MFLNWIGNLFKCKHEKKILLYSMPDYADPHCRIVGFTNHLKCAKCSEYIIEVTKVN